jgi:hypothetical protein
MSKGAITEEKLRFVITQALDNTVNDIAKVLAAK